MFPALFFDPLVYPLANYQQFTVFYKNAQNPCNHLNQITAVYSYFTPAYNSTPLASTTKKACDCYEITDLSLLYAIFVGEKFCFWNCNLDLTPKFTPYRLETVLKSPSMRSCESFLMVSDTAAYTSIVNALE